MPVRDPRFGAAVAVTEAITGQSMGEDDVPGEAPEEIRVVLPMDGWDELEYLAADDTDEPTDLPNVLALAKDSDDVCCEGEEEGDEWAFYVTGFTVEELLPLVQGAIPEGWMVQSVPAPEDAFCDAQIAIRRR